MMKGVISSLYSCMVILLLRSCTVVVSLLGMLSKAPALRGR